MLALRTTMSRSGARPGARRRRWPAYRRSAAGRLSGRSLYA